MNRIALVEVNQLCNINCEYCFYKDYGRSSKYMNRENLDSILINNTKKVYLTGGEPFINPNILNIIDSLTSANIKVIVFTNGILLNSMRDSKFHYFTDTVDRLIVSFDSFNKNYKLRSNNDETIKAINKLVKKDSSKLEVKICISKYNINEFEDTIKELIRLGVKKFSINFVHNINKSSCNFMDFDCNKYKSIFLIINKYSQYFNMRYINVLKKFFVDKDESIKLSCKAGREFNFINCEGIICDCPSVFDRCDKSKCFNEECISIWEMFMDEGEEYEYNI